MTQTPPPRWARLLPHIELTRQPGSWTLRIRGRPHHVSYRRTFVMLVVTDLAILAGWIWDLMRATPAHPFDFGAAALSLASLAFAQGISIRGLLSERRQGAADTEPPESAPTA